MATYIKIGTPVNRSEKEGLRNLRDQLPEHYTVLGNFELRIPGRSNTYEYDAVVIADCGVYAIEIKGWSGVIRGNARRWELEWSNVQNPLIHTETKAKVLKGELRNKIEGWPQGLGCESLVYLVGKNLDVSLESAGASLQERLVQTDTLAAFFERESRNPNRPRIDAELRREIVAYLLGYAEPPQPVVRIPNYEIDFEVETPAEMPYREFRARHTLLRSRDRVRVKVYELDPLVPAGERDAMINRVLRDMEVLSVMQGNPYVARAYEFMRDVEEESTMYIVSEYVGVRSLRDVIDEGIATQGERWWLAWHMMRALADIHAQGIVHRNLHPEVIPLTGGGEVPLKIADFDFARVEHLSSISGEDLSLGTEGYTAPEIWFDESVYDRRVDVFSAAAIALELITGRPLYEDVNEMLEHQRVWAARREDLAPEGREVWDGLLSFDASARIEDVGSVLGFFEDRATRAP